MIAFAVQGRPKPQPRPRFNGHAYNPPTADEWKTKVAVASMPTRPESPLQGALSVSLIFVLAKPKSAKRGRPTVKPDIDNLAKAVLDVLTTMNYWEDDSQITTLEASKRYGDNPGVIVEIEEEK